MADPNQLHFDTSVFLSSGEMRSKSSQTEKVFELSVEPPAAFKGSPSDYSSLAGANETDLNSPNIYYSEHIKNEPGDILVVEFEGYIMNNLSRFSTPDTDARNEISAFIDAYIDKGGLHFHACKIFENILNFSWMRRNNCIFQMHRKLTFETLNFQHTFALPNSVEAPTVTEIQADSPVAYDNCVNFIEKCLYTSNIPRWFKVSAEVYTGKYIKIFPAQEMNEKKGGNKSRPPTTFHKGASELTGKKTIPLLKDTHIKYALFTYDRFYDRGDNLKAININPSGFCEKDKCHYRDFSINNCLYDYQRRLVALTTELLTVKHAKDISNDCHYLIGNYLKGGVFGEKAE